MGKFLKGSDRRASHERIADILAFAYCAYVESRWKLSWQVLKAVNSEIHAALKQRIFKLFCKQTLALLSEFWKRHIENSIALC